MANIMITGATGLLGRAVCARLEGEHRLIATGLSRVGAGQHSLDLIQAEQVRRFVASHKPEVIIHCAAERRPDVSEQDPQATLALNLNATRTLAEAAKANGAWLLYISTDYVFDGTAPAYAEQDRPNPLNFYGESKWRGEQIVAETVPDAAVLRLPILYGRVERLEESAVLVLLKSLLDKRPQALDHWAMRRPTSTADVAAAMAQLLRLRLQGRPLSGIYHFSAGETLTKYQMALALADLLGLDTAHLHPMDEPGDSAKRPHDCTLKCERLARLGILPGLSFMAGVEAALAQSGPALAEAGVMPTGAAAQ
ncbi:SDR family oxidoreductase [Shewanella sp. AS16]|uniref:dTDP-4-dehydrorhamnose reductase family protein n=1 Tax=Shewanella sp. AS16 TaxID=2907625 RepID=UPI001F47B5AC|nr:SDR family oxidoreductase [Shewanella sp. AS16]MCE9685758.1 SDR family oxidoreductase [Shewanella sp. AS16]